MSVPRDRDWDIRNFVYSEFVRTAAAPDHAAIASAFDIAVAEARASLRRLHAGHALFLHGETDEVLMANPFSAVATDYAVRVGGMRYYANCAWDSLGIPAALGGDAMVEARRPLDGETLRFGLVAGELVGDVDLVVHFALPFRRWYDDLADT